MAIKHSRVGKGFSERRESALEKRRNLTEAWESFCSTKTGGEKIVRLHQ